MRSVCTYVLTMNVTTNCAHADWTCWLGVPGEHKLARRRTCNRTRDLKQVWFSCHQVCCLLKNVKGMLLRYSAFVEKVSPEEIDIRAMSTRVRIEHVKLLI